MDENIRRRLSVLRAEAYNEGFAAGKKEGYAAAIQELNEVMGSLSSVSAASGSRRKTKTNGERVPSETDQLVLEYLKESPGKTALQIAADLGVNASRVYRMTDNGMLKKVDNRFYDPESAGA